MGDSELTNLRLVGNLAPFSNSKSDNSKRIESLPIKAPIQLKKLIEDLKKEYNISLRRDSVLILVNGVEANALDDLDTVVQENDEVVIIPMFHGGLG